MEIDGMSTQEWNKLSEDEKRLGYKPFTCSVCGYKGHPNESYVVDSNFYCSNVCYIAKQFL